MGILLAALDQTIVGTALPRIVAELHGLDLYAWVATAYLVGSTVTVPVTGKLGDLFGRKPFLIAGMLGFTGASALCGVSQDMLQLVLFRGIQGIFGGMLFALMFAVVADLYGIQRRARMMGVFGGVWGLAAVVGPTLGGYLTDHLGWRSVFYVNVPVGIVAVAIVAASLPFVRTRASWRDIDIVGSVALAGGVVPLLVALSITRDHGWSSPEVVGLLAAAAALLVAFLFVERRAAHPIVPLSLFRNRTFAVAASVGTLTGFGMFGSIIFVPLVFQGVLGVTATDSGQLLTPMMLGLIAGSIGSGQLITRIRQYRFVGTAGTASIVAGMLLLSEVAPRTPEVEVVRDIVLVGLGLGVTMPLYVSAVQSALPREMLGVVSSQMQFWRSMGGTLGIAILGSLLAQRLPSHVADAIAGLGLPDQARSALSARGTSAQSLFDPQQIAATRAQLAPQLQPLFDRVLDAIRSALALTLHDVFLYGAIVVAVALVVSVFMRDVPIRARERGAAPAPAFGD